MNKLTKEELEIFDNCEKLGINILDFSEKIIQIAIDGMSVPNPYTIEDVIKSSREYHITQDLNDYIKEWESEDD